MMGTTAGNGTSRANEHHCYTRRLEDGVSASSGTVWTMPERIKAIVLDANVFGKDVEPNVTTIEKWSDACASHDAQLWIPEVVVWELAQRVLSAVTEIEANLRAHNTRRTKWGAELINAPNPVNLEDVIEAVRSAGAVVVPVDEATCRQALQDQVLLEGPGSRKQGVKTGAADSAWLRSIVLHNGGTFEELVIVTGDAEAVSKVSSSLKIAEPRRAMHLGELRHLLDEVKPATTEQVEAYRLAVEGAVRGPEATTQDLVELANLSWRWNWWNPPLPSSFFSVWEHQDSSLSRVIEIGVVGAPEFDSWSSSTTGRIQLTVSVEDQYARQDEWGELPEYRAVAYEALLEAEVTVYDPGTKEESIEDFQNVELSLPLGDFFEILPLG